VIEHSGFADPLSLPPENHLPPTILSSGRSLLVTFDSSLAAGIGFHDGFSAVFVTSNETVLQCSAVPTPVFDLNPLDSVNILSHNGSGAYASNQVRFIAISAFFAALS